MSRLFSLRGLWGLAEDLLVSIKPAKGLDYGLFHFELCSMQSSVNWQGNITQFICLISASPQSEDCSERAQGEGKEA